MRVCIVTVYNSINSGSFWQARALGLFLERLGIDVVYLKRKNSIESSSSKIYQISYIMKKFLKKGFSESKKTYQMFKDFKKSQSSFKIIPNKEKYFRDVDLFILGSDTIWNLDENFFRKNYKVYFGGIFKNKDVISYAASIANTSIEKIKEYKDIPIMLNNLKGISVRDENTYTMVKELSQNNVRLVCDPTLLLTKRDYMEMEKIPKKKDYIFLYLATQLSKNQIKDIKEFAEKNDLKIISTIFDREYCDRYIVNNPNNFLNYMIYADYIITDTFHGTIFSANLEKNFVVINRNKQKVNNFLETVKLNNRLINEETITEKFTKTINYDYCNEKLEEFRNESLNFIKNYLD